jgi:hypothetical protein
VGWLARGQLTNPTGCRRPPPKVPATTIDDDHNQITAITAAKRGALAVTYTRADGLVVQALTAHLKSKLLTFPGRDPQHPQLQGRDRNAACWSAATSTTLPRPPPPRSGSAVQAPNWAPKGLASAGSRPGEQRVAPLEGIKSVTADPASLADMEAPSDHRPVDRAVQPFAARLGWARSLLGPRCTAPTTLGPAIRSRSVPATRPDPMGGSGLGSTSD